MDEARAFVQQAPAEAPLRTLGPPVLSAEELVREEGFSPVAAAILATGTELPAVTLSFFNELLLGIPDELLKTQGLQLPKPVTRGGKVAGELAGLAGFIGGPIKLGKAVARRIPGLRRVFTATIGKEGAVTTGKKIAKQLVAETSVFGIANMIRTPEGDLIGIAKRGHAGIESIPAGMIFGAVGLIPNMPVRVLASSSVFGMPSLMQNAPLEKQIVDFGIGAYFGARGISGREARIGKGGKITERKLTELVAKGMEPKDAKKALEKEAKNTEIFRGYLKETISGKKTEDAVRLKRILSEGKSEFVPSTNEKKWRNKTAKEIRSRMKNLKRNPAWELREDDTRWAVDFLTSKKPVTEKITNRELFNFRERLEADNVKINDMTANLPLTGGVLKHGLTRVINHYDLFNRPGFSFLQKLGHGDAYLDKGITNMAFLSAAERAKFQNWWESTRSSWLGTLGNDPIRSRDVFIAADGGMTLKTLEKLHGKKAVQVVERWRVVSDMLLEHMNEYRAIYGEAPIKRLGSDYITHVFDADWKKFGGGVELPWNLSDVIVPKKRNFPFEKERRDDPNYIKDFWKATDAYVHSVGRSITDQPVRRINQFVEFAEEMDRLEQRPVEKGGIDTGVDWKGIARFTAEYGQDLAGKRLDLDIRTTNLIRLTVDRILPDRFKITKKIKDKIEVNPVAMSNAFTSLVIMEQLGGRPKPAIRNLGQHSLIIGQTGFRPLIQAVQTRGKERRDLLELSKFLETRRFGPTAEFEAGGRTRIQRLTKASLGLFSFADRINVENAFIAGFKKAKMKNPKISDAEAAKFGDAVAGRTQFPYIMENRSRLARGRVLGSRIISRPLSLFTTWPSNYAEFVWVSTSPEHRQDLAKYTAFSLAMYAGLRAFDIKGNEYTGITAPFDLLKFFRGDLPMMGISRRGVPGTDPVIFRELNRFLKGEDDLKEFLFYTDRQAKAVDKRRR